MPAMQLWLSNSVRMGGKDSARFLVAQQVRLYKCPHKVVCSMSILIECSRNAQSLNRNQLDK